MPIQVQGLRELRTALKGVSASAPKELATANHKVGQIVVDKAKELAPKGSHQGGGSYRPIVESIHANQAGTNVTVSVGGARTPYAKVTEFGGTIPRRGYSTGGFRSRKGYSSRGAGTFTRIRKRAYLYPAIAATQEQIRATYLEMLDALVLRFEV